MMNTMRVEFACHSKLLTNRLRFISLLVVINEMTEIYMNFHGSKSVKYG